MLSRMPIRKKFLCVTVLLTGTLLLLLFSSLHGVYAYRHLAQLISHRAAELKTISNLQVRVDDFRFKARLGGASFGLFEIDNSLGLPLTSMPSSDLQILQLAYIKNSLDDYRSHLMGNREMGPSMTDRSEELAIINAMTKHVQALQTQLFVNPQHVFSEYDLVELGKQTHKLPNYLLEWMSTFREDERARYRSWIAFNAISAACALIILGVAFWYFRIAVVQPFKILLAGSRTIAAGRFEQQIELHSHDELAELASALNSMTRRFVEIRDNLNEKVQQRTREVVRSEQLASVGFLAAGVAHEINNPLASIAWSAEALEGRLHEILHVQCESTDGEAAEFQYDQQELDVLRKYLKRIQDEAFRCKGITERLLDFSRLSESQRKQKTDVNESVSDMIALVQHLGQYRNKQIEYIGEEGLTAWVSPPELKQVVLNLLTNALDSIDDGGLVTVMLDHDETVFTLTVSDNGCGMTAEVLDHLFEPFFTRRRDGRGTGLGLSITYRIVQDHAGELVATSEGPGMGSKFVLTLPLEKTNSQSHETIKAAA